MKNMTLLSEHNLCIDLVRGISKCFASKLIIALDTNILSGTQRNFLNSECVFRNQVLSKSANRGLTLAINIGQMNIKVYVKQGTAKNNKKSFLLRPSSINTSHPSKPGQWEIIIIVISVERMDSFCTLDRGSGKSFFIWSLKDKPKDLDWPGFILSPNNELVLHLYPMCFPK